MVDVTTDLAYESLSENSSRITGSNRLSTSSLSGSSQTHNSGNSYYCSVCNKKLTKKRALRQNAMESDDPFDSKLPGSQITLTPDVVLPSDHSVYPQYHFQRPLSSTSSTSTSHRQLLCKQCKHSRRRPENIKRDKFPSNNSNSNSAVMRRDSGIFNIIKTTFYKLFDPKSKSPSKSKLENSTSNRNSSNSCSNPKCVSPHPPRKRSAGSGAGGYVSINNGYSETVTTPGSSIIYDSFSGDSGRQNGISSSPASTRNSLCSLGTLSASTTNDLIHEFPLEIRNQRLYSDYIQTELDYDRLNRHNPRMFGIQTRSHACLIPTHSCPPKSKSLSSQYSKIYRGLLCSSWPPSGYRLYLDDKEDMFDNCDDDFILERVDRFMQSRNRYEFNIPFSDIKFGECIKTGPRKKIFKGHWHGDVTVFLFDNLDRDERSRFWENISNLTMIRHENIVLFMGASVEPPNFVLVTSACSGPSLYEKIHMSREKMRQSFKVNLMRQIAQAVGYLHAKSKPIIVKRLNSRNIYLEPKIVLSLLDYSYLDGDDLDILDFVCVPSYLVWYIAPELLEHDGKDFPKRLSETMFVQSTDVYSFGTLLYEIHMGRYPNTKNEVNDYVNDVCMGKRPDIKEMRASETVKNIIRECWSHDPLARPEFSEISRELMKRDAARKRHSSSVPGNLNRDNSALGGTY